MAICTITPREIQHLLSAGRALDMIDVRNPREFAGAHAAGAKLIPLDDLDAAAIAAGRGNSEDPLYVICQSGGRSAKACERLMSAGIKSVYSVEGGTAAWERAGMPVERGASRVISMERQVRIGAGSIVLLGLAMGRMLHPLFLLLSVFAGAGLVFAGVTDYCGMAKVLGKMPWNR